MKKDDKEPVKMPNLKGLGSYMALTQFAYTLAIVPLILGWLGRLAGTHLLGGNPWNAILMIVFGFLGFAGEIYRFVKVAENLSKKEAAQTKDQGQSDKRDSEFGPKTRADHWDDDED